MTTHSTILTQLHQSCQDPFQHNSAHDRISVLASQKHSNSSHQEFLFGDNGYPKKRNIHIQKLHTQHNMICY